MTELSSPTAPPLDSTRPPWYRRPSGLAAAAVIAGSFALWTYAFSGVAAKDPPDTLADTTFTERAEAICAPSRQFVDGLPPAPAAKDPQDRGRVLTQATAELATMVEQLRTLSPTGEADGKIVQQWLADWDQFLIDRRAYAEVLATGADAQFTVTARDGENYTKSMDNLATVNHMESCATPGDV